MILYVDPMSTSCRLLLAVVEDQALLVEIRELSLASGEQRRPEHRAVNPSGRLPALIDGDLVLTESLAIIRYLLSGRDSVIYPEDPRRRARIDECLDWVATALSPALLTGLVYPKLFAHFRFNQTSLDDAVTERALVSTQAALTEVERRLRTAGPYVLGDHLTLADLALMAALIWTPVVPLCLERYPGIAGWRAVMREHRAWGPWETSVERLTDGLFCSS